MKPLPEVQFDCPANEGEVLLITFEKIAVDVDSVVLKCDIKNESSGKQLLGIDSMTFYTSN